MHGLDDAGDAGEEEIMKCPNCNTKDTVEAKLEIDPKGQQEIRKGIWCNDCEMFFEED